MSEKSEKTLSSKKLYSGKVLSFYVDDVMCPNGNKSFREYVTHPGGVCILPIVDGKIVMERQFRYPFKEDILELPAGKLEKGENPEFAAKRELEEETGYKAETLKYLGCIYPSVGYTNEIIYLYAAENLTKTKTNFDFDEVVDIELMDKDQVLDLIDKNVIRDAKTVSAILKYFYR